MYKNPTSCDEALHHTASGQNERVLDLDCRPAWCDFLLDTHTIALRSRCASVCKYCLYVVYSVLATHV